MKTLLSTAAILLLAGAAAAQEETTMTMDQVPANILEVANANADGMTFESVAMDDGVYEFAATTAEGTGYEVDVTEDGTVEEIEREIAMDALPAEVTAALEAELAGFTPDYIEESTREDGSIVYEFEGTHEGAAIDAEINADGTGFTQNEDAAG